MYVMYYVSMLRCSQLVWILVRTNHPCLRVGCHSLCLHQLHPAIEMIEVTDRVTGIWTILIGHFLVAIHREATKKGIRSGKRIGCNQASSSQSIRAK
jgi:hypothetical protein